MSNIIPGVPTPSDPTCALTVCGSIIAQVDCIKYIMQGTSSCIDIQFFDANGTPLDLDRFCDIQIQLTNEFDCVVANFWYPDVPTGSRGFDIEILQYTTTGGHIVNKGLLRICLSTACTLTSPTAIFAEILLKECLLTGEQEILTGVPTPIEYGDSFGIPCLMIAKITESKIAKNGGAGGCFPGYIPPQPGSSGIGFAIGSTGATGHIGSTGNQGDQGFIGSTGSQGNQGFIGATGLQGNQGFIGATGDQGLTGATGLQGPSGTTKGITDWETNTIITINDNEQFVFSGDYVLEDSSMLIDSSVIEVLYAPNKYFKKIGKLYIGGNLLLKDSTLQNDGLLSVAGGIILIGNSQITGTGTII